jgi:multidrug efflux pump subunit AcrA (membrane-fusion protein)
VGASAVADRPAGSVQAVLVAEPLPRPRRRPTRRGLAFTSVAVVVLLIAGGATAWAVDSSSNSGYRMGTATRASIGQTTDVIGTIEPVSNANAAFQVAGKVTSVAVTVGQSVTAGQTLANVDPTSLNESVSSAQSTVASDEAKLASDEDSEDASSTTTKSTASTTTTTTTPSKGGGGTDGTGTGTGTGGGGSGTSNSSTAIYLDQQALIADQEKASSDQQQEAADLAQAESACGTTSSGSPGTDGAGTGGPPSNSPDSPTTTSTTTPPSNSDGGTGSTGSTDSSSACLAALQQAASDQQAVSNDQAVVASDESNLAKALAAAETTATPSNQSDSGTSNANSGDTGSGNSADEGTGGTSGAGNGGSANPSASETAAESAAQIASDEAAIDQAQANLIAAEQSLSEATLTSPISGTVASVAITVGDTVSAASTTEVIEIIGTKSFEASGTLTSSQVASIKVGQVASVTIDGRNGAITGTVSQVGPVQSSESGYSYPVVVALPSSATGLFSGSTANLSIRTGGVGDVVVVPTSAVTTVGNSAFVLTLSSGQLTRKVVKIGLVGNIYTQIKSGLKVGQSVVLADYAEVVPSSNNATTGFGGFGGGGGFGGSVNFTGGGGGRFLQRSTSIGGAAVGG